MGTTRTAECEAHQRNRRRQLSHSKVTTQLNDTSSLLFHFHFVLLLQLGFYQAFSSTLPLCIFPWLPSFFKSNPPSSDSSVSHSSLLSSSSSSSSSSSTYVCIFCGWMPEFEDKAIKLPRNTKPTTITPTLML